MFVFLISLTLLYLSFNNGDPLEERDIYHTLFGNIGSMEDLFLKEPNDTVPLPDAVPAAGDNDTIDEPDLEIADVFGFLRSNLKNQTFDVLDFININEQYSNFTKEYKNMNKSSNRRVLSLFFSYVDHDDKSYGENIELWKKHQLQMVLVQFTMHCRYEVGKALLQRENIRDDKRYKLGYLFNRMRRLKTEQLKMVGTAWQQNVTDYRHLYTLMRLYERVVHFDMDMRDTANLIKEVYRHEAYYDSFVLPKTKKTVTVADDQKVHQPSDAAKPKR